MKTIEERVDEYTREHMYQGGYDIEDVRTAYIDGMLAEHEMLTRWHDPKEEMPTENLCVLIKTTDGQQERLYIGSREGDTWMADGGYVFVTNPASVIGFDGVVIGWREIHE